MNSMENTARITGAILALGLLLILGGGDRLPNGIAYAQANAWETEWAKKLEIKLLASLDSSGPPAWNSKKHPLVFITSEGPGYGGILSKTVKTPGIAIIDAITHEVVAAQRYELEGVKEYFESHGSGVSMDGRWIYLPTGTSPGFGDVGGGRLLIIDAKTLKLHKVLATPTNPHHVKAFTDTQGRQLVLSYGFAQGNFYVLDPQNDNRVVAGVLNGDLYGRGYLGFVDPSGKYLFIGVRRPQGTEGHGTVAVVDTQTWKVKRHIEVADSNPVWVEFSADGKFAYVSGAEQSTITKIRTEGDPARWDKVSTARAGTEGPYGIYLNWNETDLWISGKGEGSHNKGITIGLVNPKVMQRPFGTYYTGCLRNDHGAIHPDPKLNELWLTCNASFEIVIWDMGKKVVKARIPMPSGGSTHSGSFVRYAVDGQGNWNGELLVDQNGLHGSALAEKRKILGLVK